MKSDEVMANRNDSEYNSIKVAHTATPHCADNQNSHLAEDDDGGDDYDGSNEVIVTRCWRI